LELSVINTEETDHQEWFATN